MKVNSVLIVLLLAFTNFVAGQQPTQSTAQSPQRDPQALQLLRQSVLLMGAGKKATIADAEALGQLFTPSDLINPTGSFIAKVRGKDFSMETTRKQIQTRYAVLNGRGSSFRNGKLKPLANYNADGLSLDILPLLARWTEFDLSNARVDPAIKESLDGVPCYGIHIELPTAGELNEHGKFDVLLDQGSGLISAIRYTMTLGPYQQNKIPVENRFADYRDFGGILIPKHVTRIVNGIATAVLQIDQLHVNNGFIDTDFQN
jgi:hypothetical protein